MKRWASILLAFIVLTVLPFGCTRSGKEALIKCPKCGYYFETKEGADWFQNLGHP